MFRPLLSVFNTIEKYFIYKQFSITNKLKEETNIAPTISPLPR